MVLHNGEKQFVEIVSYESILKLKQRIKEILAIPVDRQVLSFRGKVLNDSTYHIPAWYLSSRLPNFILLLEIRTDKKIHSNFYRTVLRKDTGANYFAATAADVAWSGCWW